MIVNQKAYKMASFREMEGEERMYAHHCEIMSQAKQRAVQKEKGHYDPAIEQMECSVPESSISCVDDEEGQEFDFKSIRMRPILKGIVSDLNTHCLLEAGEPDSQANALPPMLVP